MSCQATSCRYSNTHITTGHKCGKCKGYGHGARECGFGARIAQLKERTRFEKLDPESQCSVIGCRHKHNHRTSSHQCSSCRSMYHHCYCGFTIGEIDDARNALLEEEKKIVCTVVCPVCRKENKIEFIEGSKIFGLTQTCSVCMEREINMRLPDCKHACLCDTCFGILSVPLGD